MLGLTIAYKLARAGNPVTVFEAAPVLGGLASVWELGDLIWDRHYHVILASDSYLQSLLKELDLEQQLLWVATQTGFFANGEMYPFTTPLDFVRFPGLNAIDKARLLATIFVNARRKDASSLEEISVSDYLIRLSGKRVFERFWLPLLLSKLGENYQHASASFIWATIRRLTAARRAGIQERFGYVPGGYREIVNRISASLKDFGVSLCVNSRVQDIRANGAQLEVRTEQLGKQVFDRAIVTTPGPVAVAQCSQLSPEEKDCWSRIRYQGIICASLLTRKPLGPYYLTNISDARVPFTGVVEMSTLVPRHEFGDRSLIYLPKYVDPSNPMFAWSDERIRQQFLSGLAVMYKDFDEESVEAFRISRVKHVFPIPTLHYSTHLPSMRTSVPGLYIVNSAHIVNGTLNVNEVVQLAQRTVTQMAA